ncbi:MAG: hypothetical protein PHI40_05720 [Caldisericia bacterium]|nr:hypothetical protein [Caldisericia bacterium]
MKSFPNFLENELDAESNYCMTPWKPKSRKQTEYSLLRVNIHLTNVDIQFILS